MSNPQEPNTEIKRKQFTRYDIELHPECYNTEYLEFEVSKHLITTSWGYFEQTQGSTAYRWVKLSEALPNGDSPKLEVSADAQTPPKPNPDTTEDELRQQKMANLVSTETMEKLVAAGWTGPRPDAQEIADQLPPIIEGEGGYTRELIIKKFELEDNQYAAWYGGNGDNSDLWGDAPTIAEALASLYLKLKEVG